MPGTQPACLPANSQQPSLPHSCLPANSQQPSLPHSCLQLHRFLRERCLHNRLTEDQARWIFQQMIVGLDFCHRMVGGLTSG